MIRQSIYWDLVGNVPFQRKILTRKKWPIVMNRIGVPAQGVIKRASVQDVLRLNTEAKRRHWSATGRPEWLREHSGDLEDLCVTILSKERDYIRCSVVAILRDGSGGHFSLDVSSAEFDDLQDLDQQKLVSFAHSYFHSFSSIPLDPGQRAEWDRRGNHKDEGDSERDPGL